MQDLELTPIIIVKAITESKWYRTGDIGVMRATGHLEIAGRIKDMINRGGEKVFPAEVEALLFQHPNVSDAYVIGVPVARLGEEVWAYVRLRDGSRGTTERELTDFCRGKISYFKVPRRFIFTHDFPLTVTGKVQKFRLRERAIKDFNLKGK